MVWEHSGADPVNANMQVGGVGVAAGNPLPVTTMQPISIETVQPVQVELTSPVNPDSQALLVDEIVGALATINTVHYRVHDSTTYQTSYKSPEGADVADNGNVTLLIRVGPRKPHITFSVAAGGDCEIEFREAVSLTANGTALTLYNMDRGSSNSPTASTFQGPTYTGGTLLANYLNPGGTKNQSVGGTARNNTEWILAANTNYIVRGINRSGGGTPVSIMLQWYEET